LAQAPDQALAPASGLSVLPNNFHCVLLSMGFLTPLGLLLLVVGLQSAAGEEFPLQLMPLLTQVRPSAAAFQVPGQPSPMAQGLRSRARPLMAGPLDETVAELRVSSRRRLLEWLLGLSAGLSVAPAYAQPGATEPEPTPSPARRSRSRSAKAAAADEQKPETAVAKTKEPADNLPPALYTRAAGAAGLGVILANARNKDTEGGRKDSEEVDEKAAEEETEAEAEAKEEEEQKVEVEAPVNVQDAAAEVPPGKDIEGGHKDSEEVAKQVAEEETKAEAEAKEEEEQKAEAEALANVQDAAAEVPPGEDTEGGRNDSEDVAEQAAEEETEAEAEANKVEEQNAEVEEPANAQDAAPEAPPTEDSEGGRKDSEEVAEQAADEETEAEAEANEEQDAAPEPEKKTGRKRRFLRRLFR